MVGRIFNCSAPDSGNIELLQLFASPAQRERWLDPLLAGSIRSCFAMSEPDVGSSDPTQLQTRIARDGDALVLNGRKWFITGAAHPLCRLALVLGRCDDAAAGDAYRGHSIVLVPMDTPGLAIERNIPVMDHQALEGHCEIVTLETTRNASQHRPPKSLRKRKIELFGTKGVSLISSGSYEDNFRILDQMTDLCSEIDDKVSYADGLYWKGLIFMRLGNFQNAADHMKTDHGTTQ